MLTPISNNLIRREVISNNLTKSNSAHQPNIRVRDLLGKGNKQRHSLKFFEKKVSNRGESPATLKHKKRFMVALLSGKTKNCLDTIKKLKGHEAWLLQAAKYTKPLHDTKNLMELNELISLLSEEDKRVDSKIIDRLVDSEYQRESIVSMILILKKLSSNYSLLEENSKSSSAVDLIRNKFESQSWIDSKLRTKSLQFRGLVNWVGTFNLLTKESIEKIVIEGLLNVQSKKISHLGSMSMLPEFRGLSSAEAYRKIRLIYSGAPNIVTNQIFEEDYDRINYMLRMLANE